MSEGLAITHEIPATADTAAPPLVMAPSAQLVRLDLGGGESPPPGFEVVDLEAPNPARKIDLFQFPWPIADNSVDELHCSHLIEHIPNRNIEQTDLVGLEYYGEFVGKDMLIAFFDECYRILKPDCWMTVVWPALQSVRAFQDPTHRRYIPLETMGYLSREWRELNKISHYLKAKCHFVGDLSFMAVDTIGLLHAEAQARWTKNYWNGVSDYSAKLKAVK